MHIELEIKKILEAGIQAPSGENCQPWHFVLKSNCIEVHNLPERDRSLYNWGQRASFTANGAAIENIEVAAHHFGFKTTIEYFPSSEHTNFVANIVLTKVSDEPLNTEDLYPYIFSRITNRKPYRRDKIAFSKIERLQSSHANLYKTRVAFVEDKNSIEALAKVGATNEYIMLSNRYLHNFFFEHINWTKEEDTKKKIGFYIKTLELPPPARAMFKLISNWSVAKYLLKIKFPAVVLRQNSATNAKSGAIGAVIIKNKDPYSFVMAGRTMQNLWLKATAEGLYIQPMTGILFFKLKVSSDETHQFSKTEVNLINECYEKVRHIFNANQEIIAMMFRVGHSAPPSAQAVRFSLEESVEIR